MDLDEWEFLPEDGFIGYHHHEDDKKGFVDPGFDQKDVFDMDYFICPSSNSRRLIEKQKNSSAKKGMNQLVPIPIQLEPKEEKKAEQELVQEEIINKFPIVEIKAPSVLLMGDDQDTISQVFFKKMKENEFVDMKLDSPKSGARGIKAQIETGPIQFEDKEEVYTKSDAMENKKTSSKTETDQEVKNYMDSNIKEEKNIEESGAGGGGLNIWRLRLTGIGALCSIGLTAATICIFIMGSRKQHQKQQNQKIRIQIYAEDKRLKQVVHHATKLNQAISAVRGVPLTRAHITFGGYYDGI